MKGLQPQHVGLPTFSAADVQEINALKTLEHPAHGRAFGRLVDLSGNGLVGGQQLATQSLFGEARD